MGANPISTTKTTYYKCLADRANGRGYIAGKSNPDDPEQFTVDIKYQDGALKGQTKTYAVFSSIDGFITGLELRDGDYGKQLLIHMMDGADNFTLTMKATSNEAIDFYQKMKVIDYSKNVEFYYWQVENENGKKYFKLGINQDGSYLKGYSFEKDAVPDWEFDDVEGKWNKSKALKFYWKALENVIKEVGQNGNTAKKKTIEVEEEDSDLPF